MRIPRYDELEKLDYVGKTQTGSPVYFRKEDKTFWRMVTYSDIVQVEPFERMVTDYRVV